MKQPTLFLITLASLSGAALPDIAGSWQGKLLPSWETGSLHVHRILLTIAKAESGWGQFDVQRTPVAVRITSGQLEQMLAATRGKPDRKVAEQLSGVELTDRLSAARLSRCVADLRGSLAKQALMVVADKSAFLDPPAEEIPTMEKPDIEAQRQMILLTVDYVNKTIHRLPNLFATRNTLSFEEDLSAARPLQPMGKFSAIVLYRDGEEQFHSASFHSNQQGKHPNLFSSRVPGLTTSGEFGPILGTAIVDASQGDMVWSRWEQGADGPEAVFSYAVTAEESHYKVNEQYSAYRGEIAIDPATGTILRLILRADPEPGDALLRADILVEYGPVELGGKTYICPVRGVAISRTLMWQWLNDVVFDQYHLYRASARVLPGFNEIP